MSARTGLKKGNKGEPAAASAEDTLRVLKNKFERGVLSPDQYAAEKARVLEKMK